MMRMAAPHQKQLMHHQSSSSSSTVSTTSGRLVQKFDAIHRANLAKVGSLFCGQCHGCTTNCAPCTAIVRKVVLKANDGACEDVLRWVAGSIYGDFYEGPAALTYTITPVQPSGSGGTTYYTLAPTGASTLPALQTLFGFDLVEPKINDTVAIAGLVAPNDVYNSLFSIVGLPDAANPTYLLQNWNPFKFDDKYCGLLINDYLKIENGPSAGIYRISDVLTNDTWVLDPLEIDDLILVKSQATCKPPVYYQEVCPTGSTYVSESDRDAWRRERAQRSKRHHRHHHDDSSCDEC